MEQRSSELKLDCSLQDAACQLFDRVAAQFGGALHWTISYVWSNVGTTEILKGFCECDGRIPAYLRRVLLVAYRKVRVDAALMISPQPSTIASSRAVEKPEMRTLVRFLPREGLIVEPVGRIWAFEPLLSPCRALVRHASTA